MQPKCEEHLFSTRPKPPEIKRVYVFRAGLSHQQSAIRVHLNNPLLGPAWKLFNPHFIGSATNKVLKMCLPERGYVGDRNKAAIGKGYDSYPFWTM